MFTCHSGSTIHIPIPVSTDPLSSVPVGLCVTFTRFFSTNPLDCSEQDQDDRAEYNGSGNLICLGRGVYAAYRPQVIPLCFHIIQSLEIHLLMKYCNMFFTVLGINHLKEYAAYLTSSNQKIKGI